MRTHLINFGPWIWGSQLLSWVLTEILSRTLQFWLQTVCAVNRKCLQLWTPKMEKKFQLCNVPLSGQPISDETGFFFFANFVWKENTCVSWFYGILALIIRLYVMNSIPENHLLYCPGGIWKDWFSYNLHMHGMIWKLDGCTPLPCGSPSHRSTEHLVVSGQYSITQLSVYHKSVLPSLWIASLSQ